MQLPARGLARAPRRLLRGIAAAAAAALALAAPLAYAIGPYNPTDLWVFARPKPALVDIDLDGKLDAFVSQADFGSVIFYRNIGTAQSPYFLRDSAANPLAAAGPSNVQNRSNIAFADLDGDGDPDAFVSAAIPDGNGSAPIFYFKNLRVEQNTPAGTMPTLALQGSSPFSVADNGSGNSQENFGYTISFADVDGDGDLDAVVGNDAGRLRFFLNTGTSTAPNLVEQTGAANPFTGYTPANGGGSSPTFVDINGDGKPDLFVGTQPGQVDYFQNTRGAVGTVAFARQTGASNPLDQVTPSGAPGGGDYSTLAFGDLYGTGVQDALVGYSLSSVRIYRNTGTAQAPSFAAPRPDNPLDVPGAYDVYSVDFGDITGDGLPDAVGGTYEGKINFYKNTGAAGAPVFTRQTGGQNPFDSITLGSGADWLYPTVADVDADGKLDLVVGERSANGLRFFKNTGTAQAPAYTEQTGAANPFNGLPISSLASATFGDYIKADGSFGTDGLVDMVVGDSNGQGTSSPGVLRFFKNTGTAQAPVFTTAITNVTVTGLDQVTNNPNGSARGETDQVNNFCLTPVLVDWDNDGTLDLIVGQRYGFVLLFRNTTINGDSTIYFDRDDANNPFKDGDINSFVRPALLDVEGDGDVDAFFGTEGLSPIMWRNRAAPTAPALTVSAPTPTSASLSWAQPALADTPASGRLPTNYRVERSLNGATGWSQVGALLTSATTTLSDSGLSTGTTYFYRVVPIFKRSLSVGGRPITDTITGAPSAVQSVTPGLPPLVAPSGLTATGGSGQISLSWTDNSSDETGFKVERSADGVNGWAQVATPAAGATTFTDTGLGAGVTYSYRVRAVRTLEVSSPTNVATATTDASPPPPTFHAYLPLVVR